MGQYFLEFEITDLEDAHQRGRRRFAVKCKWVFIHEFKRLWHLSRVVKDLEFKEGAQGSVENHGYLVLELNEDNDGDVDTPLDVHPAVDTYVEDSRMCASEASQLLDVQQELSGRHCCLVHMRHIARAHITVFSNQEPYLKLQQSSTELRLCDRQQHQQLSEQT